MRRPPRTAKRSLGGLEVISLLQGPGHLIEGGDKRLRILGSLTLGQYTAGLCGGDGNPSNHSWHHVTGKRVEGRPHIRVLEGEAIHRFTLPDRAGHPGRRGHTEGAALRPKTASASTTRGGGEVVGIGLRLGESRASADGSCR